MKKPIKVAITGKIGSGKTMICNYLKKEGFKVFESDYEVRKLLNNKKIKKEISELFSEKIEFLFDNNGRLNRKLLGDFIFSNKKELTKLEKVLYPFLERQKEKFLIKNLKSKVIFF